MPSCRVCSLPNVGTEPAHSRTIYYECARCGRYGVTLEAMQLLPDLKEGDRPRFSRWVRDQNRLGGPPTIYDEADIQTILAIPPLKFAEKADRLLEFAVDHTTLFGDFVNLPAEPAVGAYTEEFTAQGLEFVGNYLKLRGFFDAKVVNALNPKVSGDGFARVEQLRASPAATAQAFVAMWFNPDLNEVWQNGFSVGVRAAGYEPLRIDGKEHNHKICDEIIAEIRRSRFVVSDFTGHRGGVYYEAGFAAGLGIPVIFTCRKDHLKDLHFDVRQFNTIDWTDAIDLATRLTARISATIGDGPMRR